MKYIIVLLFSLLTLESAFSYAKTPHINIAPGELCTVNDKDFDRLRYTEKIPYCRRNVKPNRKDKICALYGVKTRAERQKFYTVDHIIPLFAGGNNSNKNLWCQHKKIYTGRMERRLFDQLNRGDLRQVEVVVKILSHKYDPTGKDHVPFKKQSLQYEPLLLEEGEHFRDQNYEQEFL
jgi:hypothetical protein